MMIMISQVVLKACREGFLLMERNTLTDEDNNFTSCGKRVERGSRLGREIP